MVRTPSRDYVGGLCRISTGTTWGLYKRDLFSKARSFDLNCALAQFVPTCQGVSTNCGPYFGALKRGLLLFWGPYLVPLMFENSDRGPCSACKWGPLVRSLHCDDGNEAAGA